MGKIGLKRIIAGAVLLLVIGMSFFLARGPYISNQLKRLILPELSAATGRQVMAQKIYLNLFPLFIEAKGVKVSEGGREILYVPRIKGYVGLSGLLRRELVLRRLAIHSPSLSSDRAQMEDVIRRVKEYLEIERETPVKVIVRTVLLTDGSFTFGYDDAFFSGDGIGAEVVLGPTGGAVSIPKLSLAAKNLSSRMPGWPELKGEVKASMAVTGDKIEVRGVQVGLYGSMVHASGVLAGEKGDLQVRLGLLMDSFKKVFGLKRRGEGEVSAKGTVRLFAKDPLRSVLDMELKGSFYVQTLMELLKVKERVEGLVDFSGNLKGPVSGPTGTARAHLRKGNLFDVAIDELACTVSYRDGALSFTEGKASLYNGKAEAEALITISGPSHYSLKVSGSSLDSAPLFKLIGWDPGIPPGKVRGELSTSGGAFSPAGRFEYESLSEGKDILGRIRTVKGSFSLAGDLLTLSDLVASSRKTSFAAAGEVNIASSTLSLKTEMKTSDVTDLTIPYLHELTGSGAGSGTLTGKFDNPRIEMSARFKGAAYDGYPLGEVVGDVVYRKERLEIKESASMDTGQTTMTVRGAIAFPDAKELFEFKRPLYALRVAMRSGDLERLTRFLYRKKLDLYPTGKADADFSVAGYGPKPTYKGSLRLADVKIGDVALDSVSSAFSYDYSTLLIRDLVAKRGDSALLAEGSITDEGVFAFSATGSRILARDLAPGALPFEASLSFNAVGKGTFEAPDIGMEGTFHGGKLRNVDVGDGKISASVRGRALVVNAAFFNEKMVLSGKADLRGDIPWTARLDMRQGRYDSLINAFLKETPEDLLVNMKGYADMSGDRRHLSARAAVQQLNVTLYGHSFSSDSEIRFEIKDRKIILPGVKMRSGAASFAVQGSLELNRGYDLIVEGSSSLSPLKGFSKRIDTIKGDAVFVFSLTGKWNDPDIKGGITVSNGLFGLKDIPHRISAINGYLYMDEDKIVMQKLSGKVGGGDIDLSGVLYIEALKMKRFYIDATMNDIGVNVSKDFAVNFKGDLLYKGTPDAQTMSGEININRASYRERVEWKSWLLKARPKERPRGEIGALEKAALHIKVHGDEGILVDNNIARASLKVDMLLRGTLSHPVLFGRVEAKAGTVYFRNNEFKIVSASADFSDPRRINPVLAIVAETDIKGYDIRMNLEGQLEHFNLSLISEPPLEEMDILALLTVGRFGKELKGIESGIGAGEATSFLTGKFQDVVEERLRTITGLDRLEVDPYVSKTTGTVSPRVTVSKRLLGDRLFVTYSSAVGSTENNVLKLEYLLGRNMSLVGVRDDKGSVGGDIKFRFEFK